LEIETLLPKEEEAHDQDKDSLHMANYLERNSSKSTDADELAEISPHSNGAG